MTLAAVIERSETEREAWRYTSLARLKGVSFVAASTKKPDFRKSGNDKISENVRLVFLNGVWQEESSYLNGMPTPLLCGNAHDGYRLELAGQTCLALMPLELLFLSAPGSEPVEINTRLHISLGASSRVTLIERHCSLNEGAALAHVMDTSIHLDAGAKLVYGKIVSGDVYHLLHTDVQVAGGAYYDHFSLLRGGKLTRNETHVTLDGAMAQCRMHGVSLLRGEEHADTTTHVTHAAPEGSSRQYYKTVADGKARGVFQGKIVVNEGAQKADAYQLSRALLLSGQAEIDAKPELEIYADDVSCSHGSTTADLDEGMLFYLRSRGLGEQEARALLIEAFASELLDTLQAAELREAAQKELDGWLHDKS